jgi:hypothetical protein
MLVTYIEKYSKKVLMEPISTTSGTFSKEDLKEASVNKHIPHKVCKRKDKLPWITQELKSLIRKRDRAYKTKKKSNHPQDTKKCKHLKQTIQRKSKQAYWKRNCDTREQRRSTLSSKKILDIHKTYFTE